MPDPTLSEDRRKQLDGIVSQMETNQETPESIQFVVDDFKKKYATASETSTATSNAPFGVDVAIDAAKGIGAGLASTVFHGGDLIRRGLGMERVINRPEVQAAMTPPASIAGQLGKGAEQIGEFFLPSGEIGAAAKALSIAKPASTIAKLANVGIRAGLEGASAAGISTLQTGSPAEGAQTGLITAGTTAALTPIAKLLKPLGEKIETALVKPSKADYADGFNTGNIFKYKVGGTLDQTYEKVADKLGELNMRAKAMVASSPATVDLGQVFQRARARLGAVAGGASLRNLGQNTAIEAAFQKLESDPAMRDAIKAGGTINLPTAQEAKMAMGDLGSWLHDPSGRTIVDPDSKALEKVANTLYDEFKQELEHKAVGPLRDVNRQMSELIPIRRAIIRRIPVEARSNVMNIGDLFALSHGVGWLAIANRLLKSGTAANAMVQGSPAVQALAPAIGRTVGAVTETPNGP